MALPKQTRPIEQIVKKNYSWWNTNFVTVEKTEVKTWQVIFVVAFICGIASAMTWMISTGNSSSSSAAYLPPTGTSSAALYLNYSASSTVVNGKIAISGIYTNYKTLSGTRGIMNFYQNDLVTLIPMANPGYYFAGWGGDCASANVGTCGNNQDKVCVVQMNSVKNVISYFNPIVPVSTTTILTINNSLPAAGSIYMRNIKGTSILSSGSFAQQYGDVVTLTASTYTGFAFQGWSGDCALTSSTVCQVTMAGNKTVKANFTTSTISSFGYVNLVPTSLNGGSGVFNLYSKLQNKTITASSGVITYNAGDTITLTPMPSVASQVSAWTGDGYYPTTSTAFRNITINANYTSNVFVTFRSATSTSTTTAGYTVTYNGNGNTGGTAPIDNKIYLSGSYAQAAYAGTMTKTGHNFSWNTKADGTGVVMGQGTVFQIGSSSVVFYANWNPIAYKLAVNKSGVGAGRVATNPLYIDCGLTCSNNFNYGTNLTLTAYPVGSSTFAGWSGACTGINPSCNLTIATTTNVIATFK
ncbi:MAG: InlB B-repeat-containing protein [Candidatus Falkowbacteria bacterium]